jgi:SHS2 domain-containing protein
VTYRWVEHTSELELEVEAESEEGVFGDAVAAFAELLADGGDGRIAHELPLRSADRPGRLVELLEELVFLADTSGFVPERLEEIDLAAGRARVAGHDGSPPPLVKGVTYHGLELGPHAGGWRARVVLDV